MQNKTIFLCLLCKKYKNHLKLGAINKDGSMLCQDCVDEIRNSFRYYIGRKEVTKEEFDKFKEGDKK